MSLRKTAISDKMIAEIVKNIFLLLVLIQPCMEPIVYVMALQQLLQLMV